VHSGAYFPSYWQEFVTGSLNITENMKTWNKSIDPRIRSRKVSKCTLVCLNAFLRLHQMFTGESGSLRYSPCMPHSNTRGGKCYLCC